jgi:hypothetical protein
MRRWRVWISGGQRSLQRLKDHSNDPDWSVGFDEKVRNFFVAGDRFERLSNVDEVHASAAELVDGVSLAALSRWVGFVKITVGAVEETCPDGPGNQTVMLGTAYDYREDPDQETGSLEDRGAILREYPGIASALRYIRDENDWNGYYRAYEAVGKSGEIVKRGLVTKKECERFTASARQRHHTVHSTIRDPMTLGEGRAWITNAVRRLVASILNER